MIVNRRISLTDSFIGGVDKEVLILKIINHIKSNYSRDMLQANILEELDNDRMDGFYTDTDVNTYITWLVEMIDMQIGIFKNVEYSIDEAYTKVKNDNILVVLILLVKGEIDG